MGTDLLDLQVLQHLLVQLTQEQQVALPVLIGLLALVVVQEIDFFLK